MAKALLRTITPGLFEQKRQKRISRRNFQKDEGRGKRELVSR